MEMYKFIKQLGRGKFGDIWLVKGLTTKKQYVLKQVDLKHSSKREQRSAYLEVKLLATLKHPNIVTYLDSFHDSNGSLFIIMGYCECGDMYNYIRNRDGIFFEEKQIVCWFVQICMALKYLHDRNILHRDLKTQNIFLTRSKLVKVGDLGIARVLNNANDMATTLVGTPYYMSPEIFNNKPYNHKSDVWALGCCVYEMATLKQAFSAQDFHTLVQKVISGKVSVILNHYVKEFTDIITSMLASDPEQRPSVAEILLNQYIRQHILMFLEETKHSVGIHYDLSNSGNELDCKVFSQKSSDKVSVQKSSNENHLPIIDSNKPTCQSQLKQKFRRFDSADSIVTPDINGNGDGNDNSQQRSLMKRYSVSKGKAANIGAVGLRTRVYKEDSKSKTQSLSRNNLYAKANKLRSKENLNPTVTRNCHSQPNASVSTHSAASRFRMEVQKQLPKKPHTYVTTAKELQSSGEISLNFLSNLTYTIRQARNAAAFFSCDADVHKPLPQLPPTSVTATPRSLCISVQSMPNLKRDCLLCSSHGEESSSDMNADLLKHIMNCNQKTLSNPIARQRRRERLELEQKKTKNEMKTKSAPASMDLFPQI